MPVPQNVLDALQAVQDDADAVAAAHAASVDSTAALQTATDKAAADAVALASAQQHQQTDLAALESLLQQTYGA